MKEDARKPDLVSLARKELKQYASGKKAKVLKRFFKTGPGQYGEGDVFIGVAVPEIRKISLRYEALKIAEILQLLRSPVHEERLLALLLLVRKYSKGGETERKEIYELYLKNTVYVNNWDLVDLSAPNIAGAFLFDKDKRPLYDLAKSGVLWERRISVISTFYFVKKRRFSDTIGIIKILLEDKEDLIHKAAGWMLREVGKRDQSAEELFLNRHYKKMPKTMLRYAIEKFSEPKRQAYLKGTA